MKKILIILSCLVCMASCSKEPDVGEMILGGWTSKSAGAYTYLKIKLEGKWESAIKIADVTSKIIQVRGTASGQWHIEENNFVLTVLESNVEKNYKKNVTNFYEIAKLDDKVMELVDSYGRVITWKKVQPQKNKEGATIINSIRMEPFTVNLNKTRSRDKDRYLCLDIKLILKEIIPGTEPLRVHPKGREAIILYLSSLVYNDIKSLDEVTKMQETLRIILSPYTGDMIEKVEIDHVIVASTIERVEEFIIEHSVMARISKKEDGEGTEEEKGKE